VADKKVALDQIKDWWERLNATQKRNVVLGGAVALGLIALFWVMSQTPTIRLGAGPEPMAQAVDPYALGGGRSNQRAVDALAEEIRAERRANQQMRERLDADLEQTKRVRQDFEEWTRSTGLEGQAAEARRRNARIERQLDELERTLMQADARTQGIEPFRPGQQQAAVDRPPEPDLAEPGVEPAPPTEVALIESPSERERPEPQTPRPEPADTPDQDVLSQDLFSGVGTSPRQQTATNAAPREAPAPVPSRGQEQRRTGIVINGRTLSSIEQERLEAQARRAEVELAATPQSEQVPARSDQRTPSRRARTTIRDQVPAASILTGVLLHGLDAPTGTGARGQPVPVLIRIKDLAILPNLHAADLEDCHAIGEAFGSMSEERAFGRMLDLVCTRRDGEIIHASMQGYIVGPDGKVGIRGPVVQRNGALLARSMVAGALSGFGQAVGGRRGGGVTISTSGQRVEDSLGDVAEEGAARGIGTAMENIANYYQRLAESIFAVIEVNSETPVDIVLTAPLDVGEKP